MTEQTATSDPFAAIPEVPDQAFRLDGFACSARDAFKAAHVMNWAMGVIMKAVMSKKDVIYYREEVGKVLVEYADQGDYEKALAELKEMDQELGQ